MYELSIIIPLYNSHKYIKDTISNLYINLGDYIDKTEVILTDDNSDNPDYSYLESYKNLRILHNNVNVKQGMNRNRGLEKSISTWITFMDHDDKGLTREAFDYFFNLQNKDKYNIIMGLVNIQEGENDNIILLMELIHGVFFKKEYLDCENIRFSNKLIMSEDCYIKYRVIYKLIDTYKDYSIMCIDKLFYIWSYNQFSQYRILYNNRSFNEEFLNTNIFSTLLAIKDGHIGYDISATMILLNIIKCCSIMDASLIESKNFKKDNIKYLCGLIIIIKNVYKATNINKFYSFMKYYKESLNRVNINYSNGPIEKVFAYSNRFIKIAYNILKDIKNQNQIYEFFYKQGIDLKEIETLLC